MPATNEQFVALSEPFPREQVYQRIGRGGKDFDYVAWNHVVRRLNDVLGSNWNVTPVKVELNDDGRAFVALTLDVCWQDGATTSRLGTGADMDNDPDKAIKTAQASALKKAANQYGITLELWDSDYEPQGAEEGDTSLDTLKDAVYELACKLLGRDLVSMEETTELFGVEAADLANTGELHRILKQYDGGCV